MIVMAISIRRQWLQRRLPCDPTRLGGHQSQQQGLWKGQVLRNNSKSSRIIKWFKSSSGIAVALLTAVQNHQNHEIIQNVIENNLPVKLLNQNHLNYQKAPLELLLKIICRYCGQALGYCAQDSCDKSSSGRALGGVRLFIDIIFCIGFHQVMIWLNLSFHHLFNIGERWLVRDMALAPNCTWHQLWTNLSPLL